ncbi:MAG TPA: M1 family metallopeptidase [Bacteroidales bacterium]|nr:M1 family metallopeptidase [Bacteroidales bacterium]HQG52677.1 M1 family metallopeptidase [Bacteroidales bacterium]HQJ20699.1 M1 family metallopeptidase [Bacteroidales bacterium]
MPQQPVFTRQDTLRGSITPERSWWDLTYYHLDIIVNPSDSTIYGTNTVYYRVLESKNIMQIDLQPPLVMISAMQNGEKLKIIHEGNAHFIHLNDNQIPGSVAYIIIEYGGRPRIAPNPPWQGGITWKRDKNNLPFIASSCQGDGASLWWPCKDHMYDEPDSMLISVTVPDNLIDVSNGRLRSVVPNKKNKTKTWNWFVSSPINNYGVNINIGDYVHFSEKYNGEKGILDCDYWVLSYNLNKAKVHFRQVPMMLKAFEYWFGPYPFYEDGYKLVEAPYLGMEHQSSVTYGNGYQNGYLGRDMSGTGWGDSWDFIIVHESSHEWFANNITYRDIADMWVHESFGNYSESLFVEYYNGKEAGAEYVRGTRRSILNDRPIIGIYNVNYEGSGDMYSKGGNMLHTLRQIINDDVKWRDILRGLNSEFYHQTVDGWQIEEYIGKITSMNLKPFFDQYLRDVRIPVFEYYVKGDYLNFRWNNCVPGFNMPVRIYDGDIAINLNPSNRWNTIKLETSNHDISVDKDYYISVLNMMGR